MEELSDKVWLCDLAFFADLTQHLNGLNRNLQGKSMLITDMFNQIRAFKVKLRLWKSQLSEGSTTHFPSVRELKDEGLSPDWNAFVDVISDLLSEFQTRFFDFQQLEESFALFTSPMTYDVELVEENMKLELINCSVTATPKQGSNHAKD